MSRYCATYLPQLGNYPGKKVELVKEALCHLGSVDVLTSVGSPPGVGICIKFSPMSLVTSDFLEVTQACSCPLVKGKLSLPERGVGNEKEAEVKEE